MSAISVDTEKVLIRGPLKGQKRKQQQPKKKKTRDADDRLLSQEIQALPKRLRSKAEKLTEHMRKRNLLTLDTEGRYVFDSNSVDLPDDFETSYLHTLLHWFLTSRKASRAANLSQPLDADQFERLVLRADPTISALVARDKLHNGRRNGKRSSVSLAADKEAETAKESSSKWIKLN
jgi:hypothetical protein